jgi:rubrerythrin
MFEQVQLAEQFRRLLDSEQQVQQTYAELAAELTDPAQRSQIEQLAREKYRHVEMARRLLEMVE